MTSPTSKATPIVAAIAAVLLVGGGIYGCSKRGGDDRLSDQQAGASATGVDNLTVAPDKNAVVDPATRCASGPTYALVKREIFRRAAQIRGRDDALLDRIASAAALRVERPVVRSRDEGLGSIACAAAVSVDLPPGLAVAGGGTSLSAALDYTIQPAADGTGDVIALTNAEAITVPLATIGRTAAAAPSPVPVPVPADPLAPRPAAPSVPAPAPPPTQVTIARPATDPAAAPSFSCARSRTAGERLVCSDPGLAQLDRRMAAQYREAFAAASPPERDLLRSTAHRFYGFRDNCPDVRCVANGYRGRMREIDDIMRADRSGDQL